MSRVFISYKRADKEKVFLLKDKIESAIGESCWIDAEGIRSDEQYLRVITTAINSASIFLFMYSKSLSEEIESDNDWPLLEINYAIKKRKRIVFINIDKTPLTDQLELLLGLRQQIDATSPDAFNSLIEDMRIWLDVSPPEIISINKPIITGKEYVVDLGRVQFNMNRIEGSSGIHTFYIGQFPITQNVWGQVMGYNNSHFNENNLIMSPEVKEAIKGATWGLPFGLFGMGLGAMLGWLKSEDKETFMGHEKGHLPIENITHDEAQTFVNRLSKMTNINFALPTEEEWIYAAKGGKEINGYIYAGSNDIDDVAWYKENSGESTHPVGEKLPNKLDLYDMSGNVYEWTATPHSQRSTITSKNESYVICGGAWNQETKRCEISNRTASKRFIANNHIGLRVVIRENIE